MPGATSAQSRSIALLLLTLLATAGLAQQPVPPPPRPADSGPSLQVTMKFIQDNLNDVGSISFVYYAHENREGRDWSVVNKYEASNIVADPAACRISYHWKDTSNGIVAADADRQIPLRAVKDLVVRPGDQHLKQLAAAAGSPSLEFRVDPMFYVLALRMPKNEEFHFVFRDEDLANRVARAMVHAVELCGGGRKDDPF